MSKPQPNQPPTFTSFADWCLHKDNLSKGARHTVEVLLKIAKTSDCNEAERILSNSTSQKIYYNQITDISGLSTLTNLTELYLNGNQITDLSPLQSLTNLNSAFVYGVSLPKKYFWPQHEWLSQWVLEEENARVRRLLIQVIGYDRICIELQATELDSWREYCLLKIDIFDDRDRQGNQHPVHLLKMACPSTGFIHALRVPPDMKSAREAIRWVNWDIDPEEFAVET